MNDQEQANLSDAINFIAISTDDLHACWKKYLEQEYDNAEYLPHRFFFEDMKIIAKYIVGKWNLNKTEDFTIFFNALEEVFKSRDLHTCSCISAGLIEDIQSHDCINCDISFNEWLKPETKTWWDGAASYWGKNTKKDS